MKKLVLLLASMGLVSSVAFSEMTMSPKLKVTHVGQELEIENSDGGADIDSIYLGTYAGLAYDNWTFGILGAKMWSWDSKAGTKSTNARLQLEAWNQLTPNLKLGYRYRGHKDYDRHYARAWYTNGWYWAGGDVWYESKDGAADQIKSEFYPFGIQYKGYKLGYFVNYNNKVGNDHKEEATSYFEHQIRLYIPVYKGERLTLMFETRTTLGADTKYEKKEPKNRTKDFGMTRFYLKPSYKVNENLTVWGYAGYELKDYKYEKGDKEVNYHVKKKGGNHHYTDLGIGWTYKF